MRNIGYLVASYQWALPLLREKVVAGFPLEGLASESTVWRQLEGVDVSAYVKGGTSVDAITSSSMMLMSSISSPDSTYSSPSSSLRWSSNHVGASSILGGSDSTLHSNNFLILSKEMDSTSGTLSIYLIHSQIL